MRGALGHYAHLSVDFIHFQLCKKSKFQPSFFTGAETHFGKRIQSADKVYTCLCMRLQSGFSLGKKMIN